MRLLHIISSVDPRHGGPIESVNSLSSVWMHYGHECHVASLDDPNASWVQRSPLPVFALPSGGPSARSLPGGGYGYSPRLVRWLKEHASQYDVAIVHGLWNFASLGTWLALRRSTLPYFVFTHGMLDPYFIDAFPVKATLKSLFWKAFEYRVLRDARGVLFTTPVERDLAARSFRPYIARPYVVGLGTRDVGGDRGAQENVFQEAMPHLHGRRFILFLGRIHPKKGIDLLIRAFADVAAVYPDLDLIVAGPDQVGLRASLEALAGSLGVAHRIHWPGMLTGDVKAGAFGLAEFFALTSHQENFGIAVAEALAYGTPVLMTDKVNTWQDIRDDGGGIVTSDDLASVTVGLRHLCAMSGTERLRMSTNARQSFLRRYDLEHVATSLLDTLQTVV